MRYDGQSKHEPELLLRLGHAFELVAICPEVEAGLSIPRPPVELTGDIERPRMTGRDDPLLDITDLITAFSEHKVLQLDNLCGYIFKSRSPSCGLGSTPVHSQGKVLTETSRGLFARAMMKVYPALPVCEETDLLTDRVLEDFSNRVHSYCKNIKAPTLMSPTR